MSLDYTDRTLLQLLQTDSTLSLDELARRTGSTKTPIWNRLKKLKQQGVIAAVSLAIVVAGLWYVNMTQNNKIEKVNAEIKKNQNPGDP